MGIGIARTLLGRSAMVVPVKCVVEPVTRGAVMMRRIALNVTDEIFASVARPTMIAAVRPLNVYRDNVLPVMLRPTRDVVVIPPSAFKSLVGGPA